MEHRAGFWIRFVAVIIDSIIFGIAQFLVGLIFNDPEGTSVLTWIINFILAVLYYVWFQSFNNGQTFGKKILSIRVSDLDGGRVGFGRMFLREIIGKTISGIILLIGYLMAAGKSKRALHDYIAKTIVIRVE